MRTDTLGSRATGHVRPDPAPALASPAPPAVQPARGYVAGACNIGPAEIAARRRGAVAATLGSAAIIAAFLLAGAPREARLLLGLPIAGTVVAWLQVRRRFCVAYAVRGVENVTRSLGAAVRVPEPGARRADLRHAAGMAAVASIAGAIGAAALWLVPV